jgi:hypothetical protein
MFQQHKVLMEAGFSYDQASLILEITERRAAPQPAVDGASLAWQFRSCILQGRAASVVGPADDCCALCNGWGCTECTQTLAWI